MISWPSSPRCPPPGPFSISTSSTHSRLSSRLITSSVPCHFCADSMLSCRGRCSVVVWPMPSVCLLWHLFQHILCSGLLCRFPHSPMNFCLFCTYISSCAATFACISAVILALGHSTCNLLPFEIFVQTVHCAILPLTSCQSVIRAFALPASLIVLDTIPCFRVHELFWCPVQILPFAPDF